MDEKLSAYLQALLRQKLVGSWQQRGQLAASATSVDSARHLYLQDSRQNASFDRHVRQKQNLITTAGAGPEVGGGRGALHHPAAD